MADSDADQDLADRYRHYLGLLNARELDRLGEVMAPEVSLNGTTVTLGQLTADLGAAIASFPDRRWDLRHLVINRPWLAAHLVVTGHHTGGAWLGLEPSGRRVEVREIAVHAFTGGFVTEVWTTTDRLDALRRLQDG